ncbi:MAG TPA: CorA family divalent cation transporter, partial [Actinomycetota bacterium]|nr:CorA family divalent cation transporter [Actinomycetota bacterium]
MTDYLIAPTGVREVSLDGSRASSDGGFVWSDIESPDGETRTILERSRGLSSGLLNDALEATLIPKVHVHDRHLLLVTHALDEAGHLMGLHLIVSSDGLVTLHIPLNPTLQKDESVREAEQVLEEVRARPDIASSPGRLALRLMEAVADDLERLLSSAAKRAGQLDRDLREGAGESEEMLDPLFAVRRDIVTVQNRFDQTREAVQTAIEVAPQLLDDIDGWRALQTRLMRLSYLCRGERDFFDGVLGLYEQKINVKMNYAMER